MDDYYKYCLEEIKFHNEKIKEITEEGLSDPKAYFERSTYFWKTMLPFFLLAVRYSGSPPSNQESEENLSNTHELD